MPTINLKEFYPEIHEQDYFLDVTDEIVLCLNEFNKLERRAKEKMYYHQAFYSLDRDDGIEKDFIVSVLSAEQVYLDQISEKKQDDIKKKAISKFCKAFALLTETQRKRVYAHFVLGMSKSQIAKKIMLQKMLSERALPKELEK